MRTNVADRKLLQQAIDALEVATTPLAKDRQEVLRAIGSLQKALAQPEQEAEQQSQEKYQKSCPYGEMSLGKPFGYYDPSDDMFSHPGFYSNEEELIKTLRIFPLYRNEPKESYEEAGN